MKNQKIRYAVVGAGWIAQAAFMPGVHHTGNSEMVAIVTGDEKKAKELSKKYGIEKTYNYSEYDELLRSDEVDAVYLALPNDMHVDYALRALRAGKHLLLEKPMAETEEDCRAIVQAAVENGCKLMVAYRLHFEPTTLQVIDLVRSGKIGEPRIFSSVFCQKVSEKNHRGDLSH
jgi:predicted dehydrogenase